MRAASSFWVSLALPWQCCLEEAWTAYCAGSLPIGAAVTDADGQILARGRNRIRELHAEANVLTGHRLAHAEMNALLALDHDRVDRHAAVLYTTTEPCPLCIGAIRMYGIRTVYYASRDPAAGSARLAMASPFMQRAAIRLVGPTDPLLEVFIMALYVEGVYRHEPAARAALVLEAWEQTVPKAIALGRRLHESGVARQVAEAGWTAAQAYDQLAGEAMTI